MMKRFFTLTPVVAVCLFGMACAASRAADAPQAESLSGSLADRIVAASQAWGQLGVDVCAHQEGQQPLKLRIKDKEYSQGLGHHANGEIVVHLGRQFKTLQCDVGVQWQGGNNPASVVFQVFADDKKLFDSGVMHENDAAKPVNVSVEGVKELRLVVTDAGDGLSFDAADWANPQLVRNPAAGKEEPQVAVDIAPFALVACWNPKVMTGTKAKRVQEFPAEDLAPYKEILPTSAGSYEVPVADGQGSIGLQWQENRLIRRVALQFPSETAVPAPASVQLQYWVGASEWQGEWKPVDVAPKKVEDSLVWSFGLKPIPRGTQKVRWVFANAKEPISLRSLSAFTRSRCAVTEVQLESTFPDIDINCEIGIHNGVFLDENGKPSHQCTWNTSKPLTLKVRYNVPERSKVDRTVLRIQTPLNTAGAAFGIAIEDLLSNECVYVPHAMLFATRLPAPVTLADYLKKIAGKKSVLEQVRERPDQDFTHAWKVVHNPAQDHSPTMLSLANDTRKFTVGREGTISFDEYDRPDETRGASGTIYDVTFNLPWCLASTYGSGQNLKITRGLLGNDWLPIPTTTTTEGDVSYIQTSYVVPMSDAAADKPFWYRERVMFVAEYHAKNIGDKPVDAKITLKLSNSKKKPFALQDVKEGVLAVEGERVLALIVTNESDSRSFSVKREADGVVLSKSLPAGGIADCTVCLPAWKVAPKDYALLIDGKGSLSQVESYWTKLFAPAMQIEIPDELLSNLIKASQVHCMLAARNANHGALISPWTAASLYGPLESESNAIIRGMDMMGQTDFARRGLDFMLTFQTKEGFVTTGYTIVGTGELLWTLAEFCDRNRDSAWMQKNLPQVTQISQWVARQCAKTRLLDARGEKIPGYGLMTPGVSADWDRYAYRLFNDAQYYAGLAEAGRVLAAYKSPAAPELLADAKKYREDIVRAFRWAQARTPVVKLANGTWVPADPVFLNCLGRVEDFLPAEDVDRTYGYSIDLGSHHLAANRVIDPQSKDVDWMADILDDVQFLRSGWGDYPEERIRQDVFTLGGTAKLQPYYCRIAEIHAMRDDVKPFIRSYFNTVPMLVDPENLSFWEHLADRGAWNKTHETGWFLCQTRIMFVDERGDDLWLAPFVTNHWMKDGLKVAVRNAPTRFGTVGYTITSKVANGEIEAVVQLPKDCTAKNVVLRLRHPDGKPIQSVTVNGKPHTEFDAKRETITLTPTEGTTTVQAKY